MVNSLKTSKLLQFSLIELTRFKKISFFLIFNFTLGLIGFFLLQIFQQSLSEQSAEKAQVLLGGDVSISAKRILTEEELKSWEKLFKFEKNTHFFSVFSMMRTPTDARLVNVGVFDSNYPLYGTFKFSDVGLSSVKPRVWVDPEIKELLNLKLGDEVEIGESKFLFSGVILEDPSRFLRGTGFAPRVLIHRNFLAAAQLVKPGSTLTEKWHYKIPPSENLNDIIKKLEKVIKDPVVQVESVIDSAQDSNRILKYFTDYLGLVALVALGLCFLCGSYLLQWTFETKKKSIAIFKTLGLPDSKILVIYIVQSLVVSVVSCLLSVLFVSVSLPLIQSILFHKLNLPIDLRVNATSILIIALIGVFGPLLMTVPQIIQIFELRALQLFQNVQTKARKTKTYYIWIVISLVLFWVLSIWQSHSIIIASSFVGLLISLVFLFDFLNRIILAGLEKISTRFSWLMRYSIRGLTRRSKSTSLVFTTMSLATLVLSLLPHIKTSILNEIRPENASQISQSILNKDLKLSPLVRSRILKINDEPYERAVQEEGFQTREAENEARFRNRGVNLTYSSQLQESENLAEGKFNGVHQEGEPVEISLEEKYAERVKIKVGDRMTFDIQGIEMQAKVTSLRQVRWTSFQPNFFILFQSGVLEEAPQIFLTSISQTEKNLLKEFQNEVVKNFKNVSIIDVSRTIEISLVYIEQMAVGLQLMAWLAVSVGLFVFIILLNTQIRDRLQEMNLVQILGATQSEMRKAIFVQFFILISIAVFSGVLLGLVAAKLLMTYFFNIQCVYDLPYLALLGISLVPIAVVTILIGLRPLQNLNPMDLIRQI
jgi:putative ABC transport system permease protein